MQNKNKSTAQIFHFDLYGKREEKYNFLNDNNLKSIYWNELQPEAPNYFFVNKDFEALDDYEKGFSINELFPLNGVGLTTAHDDFVIKENKTTLLEFYQKFQNSPRDEEYLHKEFNVNKKTDWNILKGYDNIKNEKDLNKYVQAISYRPFDNRYIFYEDKLVWRTVRKVMQHFLKGENVGLAGIRINKEKEEVGYTSVFITKDIAEARIADRFITNIFPLYLYPEAKPSADTGQAIQQSMDIGTGTEALEAPVERTPNLNYEIIKQIADGLGLSFTNEKTAVASSASATEGFAPIDILDYIYAVLHSPSYRETYKEFLKIDFPRVPYPKDAATFWQLVALGSELRQIHLLESPIVEKRITTYPVAGSNMVERVQFIITENNNSVSDETQNNTPPLEGLGEVKKPGYNTANPDTYKYIKEIRNELKKTPTPTEQIMWEELRNKKTGHKIRRQHIIDDFIPDFVCLRKRTIIEIDGKIHLQQKEYDNLRTFRLNQLGYDVVRFTNEEVIEDLKSVTMKIKEILDSKPDYEMNDVIKDSSELSVSTLTPPKLHKKGPYLLPASGRVFINEVQYFEGVPEVAWNFYIGGYQPAQKWLKDRKGRMLSFEDILHYQKIIVALSETDRIMKEIDTFLIE